MLRPGGNVPIKEVTHVQVYIKEHPIPQDHNSGLLVSLQHLNLE